jgi:hypothetical protein
MADVVDHPLGDQEVGQLGQAPGGERQVMVLGTRQGELLDRSALGQGEGRRAATAVARIERVEPVQVEVVQHVADPVGLVKVTWAIWATSMPWALSSTICARRQVTTDPLDRRTMRSSRLPSWLLISRTRTRPATCLLPTTRCRRESPSGCRQACDQLLQPDRANVAGRGTSGHGGQWLSVLVVIGICTLSHGARVKGSQGRHINRCASSPLRGVELQHQEAMTHPALLSGAEPTPLRHVGLRPAKGEACPLGMFNR